jgi:hypothetical protein
MTIGLLRRLLSLTGMPPEDGDIERLLTEFEAMHEARKAILEGMTSRLEPSQEADTMVKELDARDAAWASALARALDTVGAARQNVGRLRSYGR